jgi:hypothetical protein
VSSHEATGDNPGDRATNFTTFKRWNSSKSPSKGARSVSGKSDGGYTSGESRSPSPRNARMDTGVVLKGKSKVRRVLMGRRLGAHMCKGVCDMQARCAGLPT